MWCLNSLCTAAISANQLPWNSLWWLMLFWEGGQWCGVCVEGFWVLFLSDMLNSLVICNLFSVRTTSWILRKQTEFPSSVMDSKTGTPDGFVALASVSVLSGIHVPIASVFWTPGRLWGIESASELPCAWSDLQQKTGMEELIWRWVCIAWKDVGGMFQNV